MIFKWLQRVVGNLCQEKLRQPDSVVHFARKMRLELLEDRRMLATEADIVFLVDKSASLGHEFGEDGWLGATVDIVGRPGGLDDSLVAQGIDPRYGLIGFGDNQGGPGADNGHSHLLDEMDLNSDGDLLFGNKSQLAAVADSVLNPGSDELVWDAIEHGIAEYEFRDGAAVIFVIFRRDDLQGGITDAGNVEVTQGGELTHEGILAAMQSYNVTLNSIVEAKFDPAMGEFVLGVEADEVDGTVDGEQVAHVVNPVANQPMPPDFLLVSQNGSNSGTFLGTGMSVLISTSTTPEIAGPSLGDYRAESIPDAFENISGTGTLITNWVLQNFFEHKELTSIDLNNFSFDFYDTTYDSLFVSRDGAITFDGPSSIESEDIVDWVTGDPPSIPRIAPLWDFEFSGFGVGNPGDVYWEVKDQGLATERLIVQWDSYDYGGGPTETVTFQAVLHATTGEIEFNYSDLDVTDVDFTDGKTATVGIATDEFLFPTIIPAGVFIDRAHVINEILNGSEDDFVRLAWETGGAAWNNDPISGPQSVKDAYGAAFDAAFITSIGDQILRKHATGDLAFADDLLLELNLGATVSSGPYIADTLFESMNGIDIYPNATTTLSTTSTIVANGNSMADDVDTLNVFQTAVVAGIDQDLDIDLPASVVPDGSYVVELMFSDFVLTNRQVNIFLEGTEVINRYWIANDTSKIPTSPVTGPEYEVIPVDLDFETPIVKRYAVEVKDGNGLQISLQRATGQQQLLNGLRVLKTPALPTITDVRLRGVQQSGPNVGQPWDASAEVSFANRVSLPTGSEQFRPIFTEGVNTLEIFFSEPVTKLGGAPLDGSELRLAQTINEPFANNDLLLGSGFTFTPDPMNLKGTWTFDTPLPDGKYAIHLDDAIVDTAGNRLDAEWDNPTNGTPDFFADDILDPLFKSTFTTGNGVAGTMAPGGVSEFRFHFALLAGDSDGDGIVEADPDPDPMNPIVDDTQSGVLGDIDGDGIPGTAADQALAESFHENKLPLRAHDDADFQDDEIVNAIDLARWEANFGKNVTVVHGDGDANGDGKVDVIDLALWEQQYGGPAPMEFDADFNDDNVVDGLDFTIWQQNHGLGYGDADGDSYATGLDFVIWQNHITFTSAWHVDWEMGAQALTVGAAPQVTDVVISGSISTHDPFSFTTVDGSGSQLVTVPVGGADTISIVFSENVNISSDSLRVVGLYYATQPTVAEFAYDTATYTAVWRLEGWSFFGDQYLLSLTDAVSDVDGNLLDGEWTNPFRTTTSNSAVSEFPSGDGTSGGSFDFVMTLLPGDIDLNNQVDEDDLAAWMELSGSAPSPSTWIFGDFNGDGLSDSEDWDILYNNFEEYGLDLQYAWVLADLDGDFDVDDDDVQTISDNFGMTGATYADGDLNGDGTVDQLDLDLAFAQYGLDIDLIA